MGLLLLGLLGSLLLLLLLGLLLLGLLGPLRLGLLGLGIHKGEYPFPLSPPPLLLRRLGPRLLLLLGLGLSVADGNAHERLGAALWPKVGRCPRPRHRCAHQVVTWPGC